MKTSMMVPVLLALLVVGIHVEQELDRYLVGVGEEVDVILRLGNIGESALDVSILPAVPEGLRPLNPDGQSVEIPPGNSALVAYPVRGEKPGSYAVESRVTYTDDEGRSRQISCGDRKGRHLTVV